MSGSTIPLPLRRLRHRARLAARYYLKDGWPERTLFVLATARTGSNLLVSYLNSLPDVSVAREILNPDLRIGLRQRFISRRAVLRHVRHSVSARRRTIGGAKFLLHQLYRRGLSLEDVRTAFPDAVYILVYRGSLAEQFVSREIARATDRWVARDGGHQFDGTISIDPRDMFHFYEQIKSYYARALEHRWLMERAVVVSYEELARQPQGVFDDRICPLLGVPATEVRTKMRKQNRRPLEDLIENYDKVEDFLAGEVATMDLPALIAAARSE